MAQFERRLRERHDRVALAYTLERHKTGELHVHVATNVAFIRKERLARLWGHGFVDARKVRARGGRESARAAARYVSKYIGKGVGGDGSGAHSYEVSQGFQPAVVKLWAQTADEAWREAVTEMGGEVPSYSWQSGTQLDWRGPPAGFVAWR